MGGLVSCGPARPEGEPPPALHAPAGAFPLPCWNTPLVDKRPQLPTHTHPPQALALLHLHFCC
jgi:hypothetical protein